MSLPLTYPPAPGSGRLTEICTFRKSEIPTQRWEDIFDSIMKQSSRFPIARGSFKGDTLEDPTITMLVVDWTSAEEKDVFEPGERYQSIKKPFVELLHPTDVAFACHHIILPNLEHTPESAYFSVTLVHATAGQQAAVAEALNSYAKERSYSEKEFFAAAVSRENVESIAVLEGWADASKAETADQSSQWKAFASKIEAIGASFISRHRAPAVKWVDK